MKSSWMATDNLTIMDYVTLYQRPLRALKRFLYFLLWIVELVLLAEFLMEIAGFNPSAPFTMLMSDLTAPLLWPFKGIYPSVAHGSVVIDWSILIAMIVYQLLLYVLVSLLDLLWPKE